MIKYNLKCKNNHEFESWFSESKEFDNLKKKLLLECIYCNSKQVEKMIMSPRVLNSRDNVKHNIKDKKQLKKIKADLIKINSFIEKNFEFVGDRFSQKVREIHYNPDKKKNIYGIATREEKEELQEEGIDLISIPWVEKEN